MNPMKRLGMATVLVFSVMPLARTPAQAKHDEYKTGSSTYELMNTGEELLATGQVTQHDSKFIRTKHPEYEESYYQTIVSVKCQGLTPGATYCAAVSGTLMFFIADKKGNGHVSGEARTSGYPWGLLPVAVSRLNPDESWTLVLASW